MDTQFRFKIRELREQSGYKSQASFAKEFGVAQSTVAGWESGAREPNYDTTVKLAAFFGVTVDHLLGLDTEKGPLTVTDEEALDQELISLLTSLTPAEQEKAAAFVQGLIANREA